MIKMAQLENIRKMYFMEGLSIREISRRTGIHRDTISKYISIEEPKPPKYKLTKDRKHPVLGPYIPMIQQIIEDDKTRHRKQRHTGTKIFEILRGEGFTGGYNTVSDYLRKEYRKQREAFLPLEFELGAYAEVEGYLLGVLEQEIHQRENNRIQRGIRQASFPVIKTLESFDFKAIPSISKPKILKLMQGEYIRKRENIILFGNSGVGKTHIAIALGYEACRQGMRVKFYTAAGLINELLAAQQEYRLNRLEKQWLMPHLVILDELGYVPFSKVGAELLFQFCSSRYERGSLIITTNLEFPKWTEVLGDYSDVV